MKTNTKNRTDMLSTPNAQRPTSKGFTLIELLVVISIIAVLAAMTLSVSVGVMRSRKISVAQVELQQIESALENYKAKYGSYPPGNATNVLINPLYYELSGVVTNAAGYTTLDGVSSIGANFYAIMFDVGGVVNCTKGSGEDAVLAKDFIPGLKTSQFGIINETNTGGQAPVYCLVTSVGGPDQNYQPVAGLNGNPFRYANPGTNNPSSYDLWVDLSINGKTNRVSNWSSRVQIIQ